jgi:glycosyltransferase involved in cell wall biosynthesis
MASIDLSIVVIVYNMQREAPRTLLSLSRAYQRELGDLRYQVIVVDNGSPEPLPDSLWQSLGPEFRYHRIAPGAGAPSPARAMNEGIAMADGELIGLMVDGARILTPGVLRHAGGGGSTAIRHRFPRRRLSAL